MNEGHPTYPNPIISEAVCEIYYQLPQPWEPTLPGKLFLAVQEEFPSITPSIDIGLQFEFGPGGVGQKLTQPRQRTVFKHGQKPLTIQLSQNAISINVLPNYPGWREMKGSIVSFWEKAARILNPSAVNRIGLRYVNTIPRQSKGELAGKWLKAGAYISPAILSSKPRFLLRNEVRLDENNRTIISLFGLPGPLPHPVEQNTHGLLIFDIDRIVEKQFGTGVRALELEIEALHEDIWTIFSEAKTAALEKYLNIKRQSQ